MKLGNTTNRRKVEFFATLEGFNFCHLTADVKKNKTTSIILMVLNYLH
jgi:hypothetical protein